MATVGIVRAGPYCTASDSFITSSSSASPVNCANDNDAAWPWKYVLETDIIYLNAPQVTSRNIINSDPTENISHSLNTDGGFRSNTTVSFAYQAYESMTMSYTLNASTETDGSIEVAVVVDGTTVASDSDTGYFSGSSVSLDSSTTLPATVVPIIVVLRALAYDQTVGDAIASSVSFSIT